MKWLSANVEQRIADSDGLVIGVDLNNADVRIAAGRSDLSAVGSELRPSGGGDGGVVGDSREAGDSSRGVVVPLIGGVLQLTVDNDRGLAGVSGSGDDRQILDHSLTAVRVDRVGLFVEHEAVVDETTFDEPTGNSGRIIMTLLLPYRLFIR